VFVFGVLPASCRREGGDRTRTQQRLADPLHDHALPAGRWQHANTYDAAGYSLSLLRSYLPRFRRLICAPDLIDLIRLMKKRLAIPIAFLVA
jgi:hypothetical protein